MTASDVVARLLERLNMVAEDACVLAADEIDEWPRGTLDILLRAKLLTPSTPSSTIECDGCEEACPMPVVTVNAPPGASARAYVVCDKPENHGRVRVDPERLRRWHIDPDGLAGFLAGELETNRTPREVVSGQFWELGPTAMGNGYAEAFLAVGGALKDPMLGSAIVTKLQSCLNPLVLVASESYSVSDATDAVAISLRQVIRFKEGQLRADRSTIEATYARRLISEQVSGNVFRREGDYWKIAYEGGPVLRLRDAKGLHYIAYLLERPHQEIHARSLVAAVDPPDRARDGTTYNGMTASQLNEEEGLRVTGLGDSGEIADDTAKAHYRRQLRQLAADREEAVADGDTSRLSTIDEEYEKIEAVLSRASGIGGRTRKSGDADDRARRAVSMAISRALDDIRGNDMGIWRHLENSIVRGLFLRYQPELLPQWNL